MRQELKSLHLHCYRCPQPLRPHVCICSHKATLYTDVCPPPNSTPVLHFWLDHKVSEWLTEWWSYTTWSAECWEFPHWQLLFQNEQTGTLVTYCNTRFYECRRRPLKLLLVGLHLTCAALKTFSLRPLTTWAPPQSHLVLYNLNWNRTVSSQPAFSTTS